MDGQGNSSDSGTINTFVFIAGFLLGAGAALLLAPEAGTKVRERGYRDEGCPRHVVPGSSTRHEKYGHSFYLSGGCHQRGH